MLEELGDFYAALHKDQQNAENPANTSDHRIYLAGSGPADRCIPEPFTIRLLNVKAAKANIEHPGYHIR